MPDQRVIDLAAAAALDGTEKIYLAQGGNDVAGTPLQMRDYVRAIDTGRCRLDKSGANIVLTPFNGNQITINSKACVIPDAGVSLAPTGLTVGTLYLIYAWMNGATMTLEASTTVSVVQAGTGIRIKTGDATRTLVGCVRPITGPAFQDTPAQRFVLSWFNRRLMRTSNNLTTPFSTNSTAYVEIGTTLRNEFLCWGNDDIRFHYNGYTYCGGPQYVYTSIFFDTIAAGDDFAASFGVDGNNVSFSTMRSLAFGYHFAGVAGRVAANTGQWEVYANLGSQLSGGIFG